MKSNMNESENSIENDDQKMPLLDHLQELRACVIKSLVAITLLFFICFIFSSEIINYLKIPLLKYLPENQKTIHFTGPLDVFITSIKTSVLLSIIGSCPVWTYQLWKFIAPGLYSKEKKYLFPFIIASTALFFLGVFFCYFIIIPITLEFLLNLGLEVGTAIITINDYFSLLSIMVLGFGIVFETPVILVLLALLNIIDVKMLRAARKYVCVGTLVIGAILTPPDPLSQIGMAIPLYIMYEISIIMIRIIKGKPSSQYET